MPIKGQTLYKKVFIGKTEISSTCVSRKIQYFSYFLLHFYPIKLLQFESTKRSYIIYGMYWKIWIVMLCYILSHWLSWAKVWKFMNALVYRRMCNRFSCQNNGEMEQYIMLQLYVVLYKKKSISLSQTRHSLPNK